MLERLVFLVAAFSALVVLVRAWESARERDAIMRDAVALLAAWSTNEADMASFSSQAVALAVVKNMRHHLAQGTSPLDDVEEPDGSMAAVAEAWGQPLRPIAPDRQES